MFFDFRPTMKKKVIVDSKKKLAKLVKKMRQIQEFAFDTETNTLRVYGPNKDFSLVGISISWGEYDNYYIPLGHLRIEDYERQLDLEYVVRKLKPVFERTDIRIIGQNLKFDMHVLARVGINIKTRDLFDTAVASWLCDENSLNGLKENSMKLLGIQQTKFKEVLELVPNDVKKQFGYKANSKIPFSLVLIDDGAPYALDDSFFTWELYLGFIRELDKEGMTKIYNKMYKRFIRTLYKMEEKGVTVDLDRLDEMNTEIIEDMDKLEYKALEYAGVELSLTSNAQVGKLLFGYVPEPIHPSQAKVKKNGTEWRYLTKDQQAKKLKDYEKKVEEYNKDLDWVDKYSFNFRVISTTDSGAPQVNADTIFKLSKMEFKNKRKREGVAFCKVLGEYKKLAKLRSAFIEGLKEQLYDDGKAHPSFNIIGTDSGRLSCSAPNLQQLPKASDDDKYQIRSLFIGSIDEVTGKRKKIVALDFKNLEMMLLTHFSEDKNLLEMFASGADTHSSTAINMFELKCSPDEVKKLYPHLRQAAKVINFLLMYGGSAFTLYESLRDDMYNPIDLGDKSYLKTYDVKRGIDVAQIYIDKYFSTYSGVAKFIKNQKRFAHRNLYVQTLLQRKRRLPEINSYDYKTVGYNERLSVNSTVQGSAADTTISAQNRIDVEYEDWFEEHRADMLLQVHDEIVLECPEEYVDELIAICKKCMEHPFGDKVELNVTLVADADYGDSYQDAK